MNLPLDPHSGVLILEGEIFEGTPVIGILPEVEMMKPFRSPREENVLPHPTQR